MPGFWAGGHVAYGGGSFDESSSPFDNTGQCGAIHTAAFQASEAGSEAPVRESDNYSGQNPTNKEPFTEIDRTSAKFRRTRSIGSALCRIPGAPMKITQLTPTSIRFSVHTADQTVAATPVRIPQTRTTPRPWESQQGLLRRHQSTRYSSL